jgi:hypothetical protein
VLEISHSHAGRPTVATHLTRLRHTITATLESLVLTVAMPEPPLEMMDLGIYTGGLRLLSLGKNMLHMCKGDDQLTRACQTEAEFEDYLVSSSSDA